jgi:class 3 adenylate cyclase
MLTVPAYSPIGVPLIPGVPRASPEQRTYGTLLFANLHGYDALVEQLPAADAAVLLGDFFAVLTSAVLECGGQIFDLAECDMMAGFGVGDSRHTQIHEALTAARMIQRRFAPIRACWSSRHSIEIGVGIGLNRGEVVIGVFGPPERAALTLVGDTANVAAQLCRRARAGEILLSAAVPPPQEFVLGGTDSDGAIPFLLLRQVHLGGRSAPLDVWCAPAPARLQCGGTLSGHATHH